MLAAERPNCVPRPQGRTAQSCAHDPEPESLMQNKFFKVQTEASRIKTEIVVKFFDAWARVMLGVLNRRGVPESNRRIGYADFFAGPGVYEDGNKSTPVLVLEDAISDPAKRGSLVAVLNEADPAYLSQLKEAVGVLPGLAQLSHRPLFFDITVDDEYRSLLEPVARIPVLFFVDPWGYKGVSLRLLASAIEGFGRDVIFFFNYRRICAALFNPRLEQRMNEIFSKGIADRLRTDLRGVGVPERERQIVAAADEALGEKAARYVRRYRFATHSGIASHYLFYLCQSAKGHEIMGDIMARVSSRSNAGVPSFEYRPNGPEQLSLEGLFGEQVGPIEELACSLLGAFAGECLTTRDIFERHSRTTTRYTFANYKAALLYLEKGGEISADPPADQRPCRKGRPSFGENVSVSFPKRSSSAG